MPGLLNGSAAGLPRLVGCQRAWAPVGRPRPAARHQFLSLAAGVCHDKLNVDHWALWRPCGSPFGLPPFCCQLQHERDSFILQGESPD